MSGSFSVENLLSQAAQGKLAPVQMQAPQSNDMIPGSPASPSQADMIPGSDGAAQQGDSFDVETLLQQASKGRLKYTPPPAEESTTLRGVARNVGAGMSEGAGGALNVLSNPVGNLIFRPLTTLGAAAYDAVAPHLGWNRLTPEQRADLTGDNGYQQPGTALVSTADKAVGGATAADVPVNGPAERIARKAAGAAVAGAAMPVAGAVATPVISSVGAITGDQAAQAVPEWAQPAAELAGNMAGAVGGSGGLHYLGKGYSAATTTLGEHGVAVPRVLGGPGKTQIMEPDQTGAMVPALDSNGKPLRVTGSQINKAVGKVTQAAGPDIDSFQNAIQEPGSPVPGVQRTLAQQAPVAGVVDLDSAYRTAYGKEFNARTQQQATAIGKSVQSLGPAEANPNSVGKMFTDQLAAMEGDRDQNAALLTGAVRRNNPALGGVGTPEAQGAVISQAVDAQQAPLRQAAGQAVNDATAARDQALAAAPGGRQPIPGGATVPEQYGAEAMGQALVSRQAEAERASALWSAINPDGDAGAYSAPFKDRVAEVYGNIPRSAAQPSGEESQIVSTIRQWPDLVPLTEVQAMRGRIGDAISKEVDSAGKTPTVISNRLVQAKKALDSALEQTLNEEDAKQTQAVASGQMTPEQTIAARIQAEQQEWYARRQSNDLAGSAGVGGGPSSSSTAFFGGGRGRGVAGNARAGSAALPGVRGAEGEAGRRFDNAPGVQGIPRAERPLTADELARAKQARAASQHIAQTYDDGPIGDILAPGPFKTAAQVPDNITRVRGGFATQDAEVLGRLWNAKVTEAANLRAAEAAGISPEALKNWAADDLRTRAVDKNNNFDPKEYAKWRRDHAAGLHIYPEVAQAFDSAAHAQETLGAAQSAAAAVEQAHPLRGVRYLSEVPGRYLQPGDTGADAVRGFVRDSGGNPGAMQALDDHIIYRMTQEPGLMRSDGTVDQRILSRFRQRYSGALSQRNEVAGKLANLADAQDAADRVLAEHTARIEAFQKGVAQNFLHDDPLVAVRKAFGAGNPKATFEKLVSAVRGNADAEGGLRRAVADFIVEKVSSARPASDDMDFMKAGQFRAWVRHNRDALRVIFGGQGMQNLEQVTAELRKQAFRAEAAAGSPTAQRIIGAEKAGLREGHSSSSTVFGAIIGEHLGHAAGGMPLLGTIGGAAVSKFGHVFKQMGIDKTNDLVRVMLLHVPVTRELMARAQNGQVGPVAAQRIARSLQATIAANAMRPDTKERPQ